MAVHHDAGDFRLRDIREDDAPAFVTHLNDLDVVGWLARPPYPYLPDHAAEFIARRPRGWPYRAAIDAGGSLVGVVSVDPDLGYWLAPPFWRRGVVSRAASALLSAYFSATGADEVASGTFRGNDKSLGLLRKLGFEVVGESITWCEPLKTDRPHIELVLTRMAWEARNG